MSALKSALNIISIQHELVLSVGKNTGMNAILSSFLSVCHTRLNFQKAHVFIYRSHLPSFDQQGLKSADDDTLELVTSRPRNGLWTHGETYNKYLKGFYESSKEYSAERNNIHCFKIEGLGVLVVEQEKINSLTPSVLHPALKMLASSCLAAISRSRLLAEIEARKQAEKKILLQATTDELTGLLNRSEFKRHLKKQCERSCDESLYGAVVLIDLNDFKAINDYLGHEVGDWVLKKISARIISLVPKKGLVARFGGDVFSVFLCGDGEKEFKQMVAEFAQLIRNKLSKPLQFEQNNYELNTTIGYYIGQLKYISDSECLKNADIALFEAKKMGGNEPLAYDVSMSNALTQKIQYSSEIKKAINNGEFELYYQPQFNHQQKIIGAEALLRWHHPQRGAQPPDVFIPVAEQSDLIVAIGEWVINQSCTDIAEIERLNLFGCLKKIAINISAKHLATKGIFDNIANAIYRHDINPNNIALEITESIMMGNVDYCLSVLKQFSSLGVECSIDDFGTGHSSLSYLKRLPVSLLKLDRSFVSNIHDDHYNQSIASMVVSLTQSMGIDILAEGVETEQEFNCLRDLGCYLYQGYYFSRPVPYSDFLALLEAQNSSPIAGSA